MMYTNKGEIRSGSRCLVPEPIEIVLALDDQFKNPAKIPTAAAEPATIVTSASVSLGTSATFERCSHRDLTQVWYFEPLNLEESSGRFIHKASGLCLGLKESSTEKKKKAGPKSVLNYLARVAQDITKDVEQPLLVDCQSAQAQRWAMNGPAEWEKAAKKKQLKMKNSSREE